MALAPLSYSMSGRVPIAPGAELAKNLSRTDWDVACAHIDELALLASDFNPVGDGVADDTVPLQNAINAAIARNRPLVMTKGVYLITAPLTIVGAKQLVITGRQATILFNSLNINANPVNPALSIDGTTANLTLYGIYFQGSTLSDQKFVNVANSITVLDGATDVMIRSCHFDHAGPGGCNDSRNTRRIHFIDNYCRNCVGSWTPGNFSTIENNDFICDKLIPSGPAGRGHAVYIYGSFENVSVLNNRFVNISEEDIQIRASDAAYRYKNNYLIANNYFESSGQTSIWIGGDASTLVGSVQILGNRFKNANGPVFLTGVQSAIIADNHAEYDWQNVQVCGSVFTVSCGVGVGHFGCSDGVIVSNNRCIQRNPFFGTITLVAVPRDGDQITVGLFTYTWRSKPTVPGDILIDSTGPNTATNLRISTYNFYLTLTGSDGLAVAPCNVIRFPNDIASDEYGPVNNVTVITSFQMFTMTASASAACMTVVAPVDNRASVGNAFDIESSINALVVGNLCSDMYSNFVFQQNYQLQAYDNLVTSDQSSQTGFLCAANIRSKYRGNRFLRKNLTASPHPWSTYTISDGFYTIEDGTVEQQQLQSAVGNGRAGVAPIGDMHAYTLLWYGAEIIDLDNGPLGGVATLPYRWNDGDQIEICDSTGTVCIPFTFKRVSPSASEAQFNTADGLISLINASGTYAAAYVDFRNDLAAANPKVMIKIDSTALGTAGNGAQLYVTRFKDPAQTGGSTFQFTEQPLLVGQILNNAQAQERYATLQGGCETRVRTFVMSPVVSTERGVWVQGVDAASQALAPVVYRADIIPGAGFTITHAAGVGSESFIYTVN